MNKGIYYDLPENYKYSIAFETKLIPIDIEQEKKYISLASSDNLKKYFPKNINLDKKTDCFAIAGQSFIVNKLNLNDDGVNTETALRIAELFPYSYIDALHKRDNLIGVILEASFADLETNEELSKEEIKDYKKPFACIIGGIIWKAVNKKFTELLASEKSKDSLYISWELAFSEHKIIKLPKDKFNFIDGEIIGSNYSEAEFKELNKKLKSEGGTGLVNEETKIGRVIVGDCIPLGIGIVTNPAGQVEPLVILAEQDQMKIKENNMAKENIENSKILEKLNTFDSTFKSSMELLAASINNFTKEENSVTNIVNNIQQNTIMDKITKISDITDESLKQISNASVIKDFFNEELQKADQKFLAEQRKAQEVETEKTQLSSTLAEVQKELKILKDAAAAKEAQDTYNQRMTYFDDTYELIKEERQVIASEIQNVDQETFEKIKNKYEVFLKEKSKASIKAKNDKAAADLVTQNALKQSQASTNTQIVNTAIKNGNDTNTVVVPNAASPETPFADKFAEHFKPEDCVTIRKY